MPLFKCPKCNRDGYIPMAFCDEVLHLLPHDSEFEFHFLECVDCESNSATLQAPVKWHPPNGRNFAITEPAKPPSRRWLWCLFSSRRA